jgi:hypothetical protein
MPDAMVFDEYDVKKFMKDFWDRCEKENMKYLLIDLTNAPGSNPSRRFRRQMSAHMDKTSFERIACVVSSPVTRMIGKVMLAAWGKKEQTNFFKTVGDALSWLKGKNA